MQEEETILALREWRGDKGQLPALPHSWMDTRETDSSEAQQAGQLDSFQTREERVLAQVDTTTATTEGKV